MKNTIHTSLTLPCHIRDKAAVLARLNGQTLSAFVSQRIELLVIEAEANGYKLEMPRHRDGKGNKI